MFKLKELKLEVTHQCRLSCIHCSSNAQTGKCTTIPKARCFELIEEAKDIGCEEIAFSGGEPLLWEPLADALCLAKLHQLKTKVYSTGYGFIDSPSIQGMSSSNTDCAIVSIYSTKNECHDSITGVSGSLQSSLSFVKMMNERGIQVEFHFVPMQNNYLHLPEVVQLASDYGVSRVSVLRLVPHGRACLDNHALDKKETMMLGSSIRKLIKNGSDIRVGTPYNILALNTKTRCMAAIDRLTVSPALEASPCDAFKTISPKQLGILENSNSLSNCTLKELWHNSPYFNTVRTLIRSGTPLICKQCAVEASCKSGCLAQKIHSGSKEGQEPDPLCLQSLLSNDATNAAKKHGEGFSPLLCV